jgi:hypothetical protein
MAAGLDEVRRDPVSNQKSAQLASMVADEVSGSSGMPFS